MPRPIPITSPAFVDPILPSLVLEPPASDNWHAPDGLRFAGGAFITLRGRARERFGEKLARLAADRPPLRRRAAEWVKPELVVGVRHLRGPGALRHATVYDLQDG